MQSAPDRRVGTWSYLPARSSRWVEYLLESEKRVFDSLSLKASVIEGSSL